MNGLDEQHMPQKVWEKFRENIEIKDRKYHLKSYTNCFVGSEAGL
jgi:hypothetical protein